MSLPSDSQARKDIPMARGLLDYFPDALAEVAMVSAVGNEQHHAGAPLHWDKSKSADEADALLRHLVDRGKRDHDGQRHSAKVAWRGLALLQRELEAERETTLSNRRLDEADVAGSFMVKAYGPTFDIQGDVDADS